MKNLRVNCSGQIAIQHEAVTSNYRLTFKHEKFEIM